MGNTYFEINMKLKAKFYLKTSDTECPVGEFREQVIYLTSIFVFLFFSHVRTASYKEPMV